mmetsp:Transcript_15113/g.14695  ORF Transcript_15113/g.14695 Transcript_15113/m.14695 type:complete len:237 (-) Transcript_15113:761-1471(-)|eukprot:CAMPEP_0170557400 /NCGR_PEP_ID=MMETSP0211-20121228/25234_1 /TAXON_ID=311385 /ORGANISM="Pseudokeronopsis sp., Strain OXSARD2" /LENGTH=236 /DNA_ID=CAMNT_0010868399 /DNA_START=374 /DNA_END=1084 /DNA_ORIENTATION=+
MEKCGDSLFNHTDPEESSLKDIGNHYCATNKSQFRIGGTWMAERFEFVQISLNPCINFTDSNVTCASSEAIYEHFMNQVFIFRVTNHFFDKDEVDNPIKSYIVDSVYFGVVPDFEGRHDIYFKKSMAKYDSSLMPWASKEEKEFLEYERTHSINRERKNKTSEAYLILTVRLDLVSTIYQKNLFTIMDYVSLLGGLFNSLYAGGKLAVFLFMESLMLQRVIRALFKYSPDQEEDQK